MAKEKIKKITEEEFTGFDDLAKGLSGGFDNSLLYERTPDCFLDTGYLPLNKVVSDDFSLGLKNGILVEISGPESSGKTAISTNLMISSQNKGGVAMFFDHEYSFESVLAEKLGLDLTPGKFFYKRPVTGEESIDLIYSTLFKIRKTLPNSKPIVVVLDSWAAIMPAALLASKTSDEKMNHHLALAQLANSAFKKLKQAAKFNNALIIVLNQERKKIGIVFGDSTKTAGGDVKNFYFDIRLRLGRQMIKDAAGNKVGQKISCEAFKNKISTPFRKTKWDFLFKNGGEFDTIGSTIDFMKENGLIETSGNYLIWEDKKYYRNALRDYIENNGGIESLNKILISNNDKIKNIIIEDIVEEVEE